MILKLMKSFLSKAWLSKSDKIKRIKKHSKLTLLFAKEVIYIEDKYYPELNQLIRDNIVEIEQLFHMHGNKFTYLPMLENELNELIKYHHPEISSEKLNKKLNHIQIQEIYNYLYTYTENYDSSKTFCGLIEINSKFRQETDFNFYPLGNSSNIDYLKLALINFFNRRYQSYSSKEETIKFKISDDYDEQVERVVLSNADELFDNDANLLVNEIRERIEALKSMGITQYALEQLLQFKQKIKLSRLVISSDNKIFLPDYDNTTIEMSPLPKAVFFLFLKHPEGIVFKDLPDYREELKGIYLKISSRENLSAIQKSIDDLTDPTKNAINEKCSRIREAFISKFDDKIAMNYYVTGERLTPKKIILDRKLLEWH